jgi:hypothetical protein
LIALGTLPFMAFGAEAELQMYMGEDEGDVNEHEANSSGGIVVESLLNLRTVASLAIEEKRADEYASALAAEDPHAIRDNAIKGSTSGLGQFVQMWGIALMFCKFPQRLKHRSEKHTRNCIILKSHIYLPRAFFERVGRLAALQSSELVQFP